MAKFKDRLGREWEIEITLGNIPAIRKEFGVELDKPEASKKFAELIYGDPELFGQFIYTMCREQAEKAAVSPEEFASGFNADALDRATLAIMEARVDILHRNKASREERRKRLSEMMDSIDREMGQATAALLDEKLRLRDTSGELTMPTGGASSGSASSGAIQAGKAFVKLFVDDASFTKGLNTAQKRMAQFGSFLGGLGTKGIGIGAAMLAPITALAAGALGKAKEGLFGPEAEQMAKRVSAAWESAMTSLQAATLPIIEAVLPAFEKLAELASQNAELVQTIAAVGAGLIAAGIAAKIIGVGLSVASAAAGVLATVIGVLSSPIGLAAAGIAALGAALLTQTEAGREVMGELQAGVMETLSSFKFAWGGIVAAIKKGDLEAAFEIAGAALKLEWTKIVFFWTDKWVKFKGVFVDGWHDIGFSISSIWNSITTGLETALRAAMEGVITLFNRTVEALSGLAADLLDSVGLGDWAGSIREAGKNSIPTGWLGNWQKKIDKNHDQNDLEIGERRNKLMEANKNFRDKQLDDAGSAVQAARIRLVELVEKAMEPIGGKLINQMAPLPDASKGLFQAPNFAAALAVGDAAQEIQGKQLDQQKQMNKKLAAIEGLIKDNGMVFG